MAADPSGVASVIGGVVFLAGGIVYLVLILVGASDLGAGGVVAAIAFCVAGALILYSRRRRSAPKRD